jgi:hypothetical protein
MTFIPQRLLTVLQPILSQTTSVLDEGSKVVIDSDDQYEVGPTPRRVSFSQSLA